LLRNLIEEGLNVALPARFYRIQYLLRGVVCGFTRGDRTVGSEAPMAHRAT
jgi:hypothetical protein